MTQLTRVLLLLSVPLCFVTSATLALAVGDVAVPTLATTRFLYQRPPPIPHSHDQLGNKTRHQQLRAGHIGCRHPVPSDM